MLGTILFLTLLFSASQTFGENTNFPVEKWETNNLHYNPDIYYNLGVYYITKEDTAKAILNLKRAFLLSPEDKKIKSLLDRERKKLDIPIISYEPSVVEKFFSLPFTIFSINGLFLFGIILLSSGSIIISINLSKLIPNKILYDKRIFIAGIIIFIIGLVYCIASFIRYNITFNKKEAVVLTNEILYDIPSSDGIKLLELKAGTEVKITKIENEYYLVSTLSGKEGYIKTNSVERLWK
ncbi:MAG: hypothetical protein N2258_06410 [Brevinematales bacterium]|nr:hypothetical protein [Brevinematales bacterium]